MPASVRRSNLAGADVLRQASWPSNKKGWLMNCAICGKDNQAGTRFCVHCGAALTIPPAGAPQQNTIAAAGAILGPKSPPTSSATPPATAPPTATVPIFTPRPAYAPPPADIGSV